MTANEKAGRWIPDPDDPEFEIWEPAKVEGNVVDDGPSKAPMKQSRNWDPEKLANRCRGHRKNGERCRRAAIAGGTVCRVHGGAAPAVKAAARARLEMAADQMAINLLRIAVDDDAPDSVKLSATNSALDRAGLSAKTAVEVSVDPKPFQEILEAVMTGGSRAESRSRRGELDDHAAPDADWIDAELVEVQHHDDTPTTTHRLAPRHHDEPRSVAGDDSGNETGMLDLADALDQLRGHTPPPQGQR